MVEMLEEIARDMLFLNRISLLRSMTECNVQILTSHKVKEITDTGVVVEGPDGELTLKADTVVAAFGVRPAQELAEELGEVGAGAPFAAQTAKRPVHPVGDCVAPRKVGDAINAAYELAFSL